MKLYQLFESVQYLRVADVGYIHGAHDDRWMFQQVLEWLRNNDPKWYEKFPSVSAHDHIDLNVGRDFLQETKEYDIVILHLIYHDEIDNGHRKNSYFAMSELHSLDAWRKRLVATGTKYIFTFGDYAEISGHMLGQIGGYELLTPHDFADREIKSFHVYKKLS